MKTLVPGGAYLVRRARLSLPRGRSSWRGVKASGADRSHEHDRGCDGRAESSAQVDNAGKKICGEI